MSEGWLDSSQEMAAPNSLKAIMELANVGEDRYIYTVPPNSDQFLQKVVLVIEGLESNK